jgi:UbiD family decarboxylase
MILLWTVKAQPTRRCERPALLGSTLARHAEFAYVGGLRGMAVPVTKCETLDMLVPAHSEIILKGQVLPKVRV